MGLREFVWVGGCVTALAAWWASPPGGATQECTQIGETGLSAPFWGTCVHCCDASFATRVASGGTSIPTTMACRRRPLAGPSRLVGKTGSARVAPPLGWHLRQGSNPHKSSMSLGTQGYTKDEKAVHRAKAPSPWICSPDGLVTLFPFKVGRDWSDSGGIQVIGFAVEQIPGEGVAVRSVGVLSRHWSGRETQTRNREESRGTAHLSLGSISR